MSELCLYEFEDIVWDEHRQSDDHIVPHPGFGGADNHSHLGDSLKKSYCEVTNISYNAEDRSSAGYVGQGSEEGENSSLTRRKNTMLEKNSLSHAQNDISSSPDGESIKQASNLVSEDTTPSVHAFKNNNVTLTGNEFCRSDAIHGGQIADVDNNSSSDSLGGINHTGAEDKDSSDFLYYGWPDIENFEDVDRMFSTCDSTFGLGTGKEDGLDWFSSADNMGGSGDVMNPDFKFPCPESNPVENIPPDHDSSKSYSFCDSVITSSARMRLKDSPWMSEKSDSYMSFVNGPAIDNDKEGFIAETQMTEHQKQVKPQNHSEGKGEEHDFIDGCVSYIDKLPNEVGQLSCRPISHQAFPSVCMQQQQQQQQQQRALCSDSCNYLQNHPSYMHSDNSPLSDLTSVNPTSSAVKSENNDLKSPSPRDSSHASSQLSSIDGCHGSSLPVTALAGTGKREKLHNHQDGRSSVDSSLKHTNAVVHGALHNPGSEESKYTGVKSENHSDIRGGTLSIPAELGSSNVQESSSISTGMDDISLEAASFHQLQLVMEQLDLRTKICIRDSLYRLARSAERRHNHSNSNGSCGNGRDANGAFMAEGGNIFMDIETDTNPIDRSVAHLLFHRPPESSHVPVHDSQQFKSPSMILHSVTSQPLMVENLNNSEETASGTGASDQ